MYAATLFYSNIVTFDIYSFVELINYIAKRVMIKKDMLSFLVTDSEINQVKLPFQCIWFGG